MAMFPSMNQIIIDGDYLPDDDDLVNGLIAEDDFFDDNDDDEDDEEYQVDTELPDVSYTPKKKVQSSKKKKDPIAKKEKKRQKKARKETKRRLRYCARRTEKDDDLYYGTKKEERRAKNEVKTPLRIQCEMALSIAESVYNNFTVQSWSPVTDDDIDNFMELIPSLDTVEDARAMGAILEYCCQADPLVFDQDYDSAAINPRGWMFLILYAMVRTIQNGHPLPRMELPPETEEEISEEIDLF